MRSAGFTTDSSTRCRSTTTQSVWITHNNPRGRSTAQESRKTGSSHAVAIDILYRLHRICPGGNHRGEHVGATGRFTQGPRAAAETRAGTPASSNAGEPEAAVRILSTRVVPWPGLPISSPVTAETRASALIGGLPLGPRPPQSHLRGPVGRSGAQRGRGRVTRDADTSRLATAGAHGELPAVALEMPARVTDSPRVIEHP